MNATNSEGPSGDKLLSIRANQKNKRINKVAAVCFSILLFFCKIGNIFIDSLNADTSYCCLVRGRLIVLTVNYCYAHLEKLFVNID